MFGTDIKKDILDDNNGRQRIPKLKICLMTLQILKVTSLKTNMR